MFLFFLALLANATGWNTTKTTVSDCGAGKSVFTIQGLSLDPPNPVPNDNVSLHLDYSVPSGVIVTDGQAKYAATYNFIPLSPTIEPLCKNIPCPLSSGSYSNTTYMLWPSGLSGSLSTSITWVDERATQLLCIRIVASF
jgi:hypothetical protein